MELLKLAQFNTGRYYAADKQPISYGIIRKDNGRTVVYFIDHARGIDGEIDVKVGNIDIITNDWVLRAYDDFHYSGYDYELGQFLRDALRNSVTR